MKDNLSLKKNTWKYDIFFKCSEKMVFQNENHTGIWSFLLCYLERRYFFFPKIGSYSFDGKWKMIFLKKIHGNMIFPSNAPKRWSFQKKLRLSMIFLSLSGKMVFFSGKYIFSLVGKWKMIFLKKYMEIWYFLYICINVTNMIFSLKNTRKVIDILDRILDRVPTILCTFMETFIGIFRYCFAVKKKPGNLIYRIEIWLLLQSVWLEIFYNEKFSIHCTIQLQELYLEVCLSTN